jgi:hypothetical protein
MNSAQSEQWITTEQEELNSLVKVETWKVIDRSKQSIVDSKWVYKIKQQANELVKRYKARLMTRDFTQRSEYDFDEIFSSVVHYKFLWMLFALSA